MRRAAWTSRLAEPTSRITAVAVLVALLVVVQFIILISGGLAAGRAADRAMNDSFEYLADITEERVATFVDSAARTTNDTADDLALEPKSTLGVIDTLHGQLMAGPQVRSISVTYADGDFVVLAREPGRNAGFTSHTITHGSNGQASHRFVTYDSQMRMVAEHHNPIDWMPTQTDAYRRAAADAGLHWTEPTRDPLTGKADVWVSRSVRDEDGELVAVVASDLMLGDLTRTINELPAGADGEVFVLSQARAVIAGPAGGAPPLNPSKSTDLPVGRLTASATAAPATTDTVFGKDGDQITVERGLAHLGVPWVMHMQASELGVNEGFTRLRHVVGALVGSVSALTLALGYLVWRGWRPLMAMRDTSERDPLTGLFNRRSLDAKAARLLRAAHRHGRRVALVMMDLDNFKALNDDLGHQAGDAALEEISSVLVRELRAADLAVRFGGDEFLVMLTLGSADDPHAAVERIRRRVESTLSRRFAGRAELGVTAGFVVTSDAAADVESLVSMADAALVDGKWLAKGATYAAGLSPSDIGA